MNVTSEFAARGYNGIPACVRLHLGVHAGTAVYGAIMDGMMGDPSSKLEKTAERNRYADT